MATPNFNAILQAILTVTDNTLANAPYDLNINLQNPTLGGTKYYYDGFFQVPTVPVSIPLGAGGSVESYFLLIWNRSTTNALTIGVTPGPSGSPQTIGNFGPGGVCILMDPTETGGGWEALVLTGLGATVPVTIFTAI
jgi:hypothetical protein